MSFGKKVVEVDGVEVESVRSFTTHSLNFRFEIDNLEFFLRKDNENFDIFEEMVECNKFKNLLKKQEMASFGTKPSTKKNRYADIF